LACSAIVCLAFVQREEDPRTIADKKGTYLPSWGLGDLAKAMHHYHEKHGRLPPAAVYSKDGVPLLSWRVLLLPYLGQEELFRQFKLDEAWDSPHNLRLLPQMPWAFSPIERSPPQQPYTTLFRVFVGQGTAFEGHEGLQLKDDFGARISDTILIVEAGDPVPWTKPEDIPYDKNRPLPKLGAIFKGYFHAALADASTRRIRQDIKEATLRAAVIRNGDGPGDEW